MEIIHLYNTLGHKVEEFHEIKKGKVGLYTCGPTVYNYAHIGNLRTYIFEDVLKKMLRRAGYSVKHVMNITDVGHLTGDGDDGEDKMEKAAHSAGKSVYDIATFYTKAFFEDEQKLNIEKADVTPKATEHIKEIIALILRLEEKGFTYRANGNVYFSIDKFPSYGELANLKNQQLNAGARIEVDKFKKNPHDFVLWFTNSKFEHQAMMWDSPFGKGYPGWHIECSAMSMKYLGEHFDIHCGGVDAIPVHHTNEIAQSEAVTGKKWVNYWLHGEFLLSEKGKMSKSSGEFLTLSVLEKKGYLPLSYRYFVLGCHYRKQLQFSYDALNGANTALLRLYDNIEKIVKDSRAEKSKESKEKLQKYTEEFNKDLFNDMNMPKCLATLQSVVKDKDMSAKDKISFIKDADTILSLDFDKVIQRAQSSNKKMCDIPKEIIEMAEERVKTKKCKDFKKADELRSLILEKGYSIKDMADGYELIREAN